MSDIGGEALAMDDEQHQLFEHWTLLVEQMAATLDASRQGLQNVRGGFRYSLDFLINAVLLANVLRSASRMQEALEFAVR
eukprot:9705276-Lingulodinium_polyedra.AAC.1